MTIPQISRLIYEKIGIFHKPNKVTYFAFGIVFNRLLPLKAVLFPHKKINRCLTDIN